MAEFVLKNWHGEEMVFDHDKIFVKNLNGDLIQFTEGKGEAVLESLEVTENGTFTPPEGVDGFNQVTVNVEEEVSENLMYYEEMTFASNSNFGGLYTAECPEGILNYGFEIELGQEYIITWDTQYYCVFAQDGSSFIPGTLLLGNGTSVGLEGKDEPFAIVWTPESLTFVSVDTSSTHGVAVMKRVRPNSTNMMLQNITITENGEYIAEDRYDGLGKILVDIASKSAIVKTGNCYRTVHNGANKTITHGLGVVPDLIIISTTVNDAVAGDGLVELVAVNPALRTLHSILRYGLGVYLSSGTVKNMAPTTSLFVANDNYTNKYAVEPTDTTFLLPRPIADYHYQWIAIGGLT